MRPIWLLFFLLTSASSAMSAQVSELNQEQFVARNASLIDFQTGLVHLLPVIPGVSFIRAGDYTTPPWFGGTTSGGIFLSNQGYTNTVVWITNPSAQALPRPLPSPEEFSFSDLAIEFLAPQAAVGAWIGIAPNNFLGLVPSSIQTTIYDENSVALASKTLDFSASDEPVFVGFEAAAGIARIEWRGGDKGFFGIDNVMYLPLTPVPLPPSIALLLSSLLASFLPSTWFKKRRTIT